MQAAEAWNVKLPWPWVWGGAVGTVSAAGEEWVCRFMAPLVTSLAEHRCLFHLAQPLSCLLSRASKSQLSWQSRDGVTSGHGEWERGTAQLLPVHSRDSALTTRISVSTLRSIYFFPLALPSTSSVFLYSFWEPWKSLLNLGSKIVISTHARDNTCPTGQWSPQGKWGRCQQGDLAGGSQRLRSAWPKAAATPVLISRKQICGCGVFRQGSHASIKSSVTERWISQTFCWTKKPNTENTVWPHLY